MTNKKVNITFEDIVGLLPQKASLQRGLLDALQSKTRDMRWAMQIPHSYLFYGPPGAGKSLLASAIIGEYTEQSGKLPNTYHIRAGLGENIACKEIIQTFKSAKEKASRSNVSFIIVDDIDYLLPRETEDVAGFMDVDDAAILLCYTYLQDVYTHNLITISTTSSPWNLAPIVLRKCEPIFIPPPLSLDERVTIYKHQLKELPVQQGFNLTEVVRNIDLYSPADIIELCGRAKRNLFTKSATTKDIALSTEDLLACAANLKNQTYAWAFELQKFLCGDELAREKFGREVAPFLSELTEYAHQHTIDKLNQISKLSNH